MKEQLLELLEEARKALKSATSVKEVEEARILFSGKKGKLTALMKGMGALSKEERPIIGKVANEVRTEVEQGILARKDELKKALLIKKLENEKIDVTRRGVFVRKGELHPLTKILRELEEVFIGMGFSIAEGPEVETVFNNFDALNSPPDHPARSTSDTFYITDDLLLRTHTSPVQIRAMQSMTPPIKIISPGRCFRFDELDATHSPMFHQLEGLVIDKNITMADLKGTLDMMAKLIFGEHTKTKFRPHHFPFTEPSAEVDVSCFKCAGEGCRVCGNSGWIEILGCGMVHPRVLQNCGIDPEQYSGFAFGMGIDRMAMLKMEIDDIRLFFENDMRFIEQF